MTITATVYGILITIKKWKTKFGHKIGVFDTGFL